MNFQFDHSVSQYSNGITHPPIRDLFFTFCNIYMGQRPFIIQENFIQEKLLETLRVSKFIEKCCEFCFNKNNLNEQLIN